jgi:hypothetical protein
VRDAGYQGDIECEVFRQEVWDAEPAGVARSAAEAYERLVVPFLEGQPAAVSAASRSA